MRITPTLFNFTLNPDAGMRLDMRAMFDIVARTHQFPLRLNGQDIVDFLQIDTVLACLPGGRGCVGKERLGRTLHDRQVALVDASGVKYNPARPGARYGFLHLIGFVQYKDGKQNKIVIPVEPTGVIGLRAGSSSLSAFDPNENVTQNRLLQSISEIETILFKLLNIPKRNEPKMAMLNAYFNIFTDKTGKDRPRITNFVRFLRDFYNTLPELKDKYNQGTTPWLKIQGGPTVMKSSFKPKFENSSELHKNFKKNVHSPPTFTMSPYGHVELMGAKSFVGIKTAYNIIVQAARIMKEQQLVAFQAPEIEQTGTATRARVKKNLDISKYFPISFSKKDSALLINKKSCDKYPKNFVTYLADINGIPSRGKIGTVCQRLYDLPQLVQIAGEKEATVEQPIRTKLNRKGVPQITVHGRQCKTMSKKDIKKHAEEYNIDPNLPVKEICRLLAVAVNGVPTVSTLDNLPENAIHRFARSKRTIDFFRVYNPEKPLNELQQIARDVWTGLMDDEQRRQWIRKHLHDSPVSSSPTTGSSINTSPGSKKSSPGSNKSASIGSKKSASVNTPSSNFLHSLYGNNSSPGSKKSSPGSKKSASVNTPSSNFLHSLYGNNSSPGSKKSASGSNDAMMRFVTHRNIIARLRSNHPGKSRTQLVQMAKNAWKNDYDNEARRNWLASHPDPNSEAAMFRFVTHQNIIDRLRNDNPDKTLKQLVQMAKNAWANDYANREARVNWLGNHDRNMPANGATALLLANSPPKTRVVRKDSYYVVEPVNGTFKKVMCASKSLVQLKKLAEDEGVSTHGTKKDICERIALYRNAKGRPVIIEPAANKGTERTTPCEKKTLKFLQNLAKQMRVGASGTKHELCKRMSA